MAESAASHDRRGEIPHRERLAEDPMHRDSRPTTLATARHSLTEQVLRDHVAHPDQDRYVTALLAFIGPAVAAWRALPPPRQLKARHRIDLAAEPSLVAAMIKYAVRVLGVHEPDVYRCQSERADYALLNTKRDGRVQPSLVLFDHLPGRHPGGELAYRTGRALADLYVPHYAAVALDRSPVALRQVLQSCIHGVGVPQPGDPAVLNRIASEVHDRMRADHVARFGDVVRRFVASGAELDSDRWLAAAEHTACRVGLLLSGDLRSAARAISTEPLASDGVGLTTASDRLQDLERYAVSDDYLVARKSLGIVASS